MFDGHREEEEKRNGCEVRMYGEICAFGFGWVLERYFLFV